MSGIVERLHRAGLRAIGPRVFMLTALEHDCSHPTAKQRFEALWPQYPFLALSTVYQTFDAFIRTGPCRRFSGAGDHLRADGTPLFPLPSPPARLPRGLLVTRE